jgi:hypothetical protein
MGHCKPAGAVPKQVPRDTNPKPFFSLPHSLRLSLRLPLPLPAPAPAPTKVLPPGVLIAFLCVYAGWNLGEGRAPSRRRARFTGPPREGAAAAGGSGGEAAGAGKASPQVRFSSEQRQLLARAGSIGCCMASSAPGSPQACPRANAHAAPTPTLRQRPRCANAHAAPTPTLRQRPRCANAHAAPTTCPPRRRRPRPRPRRGELDTLATTGIPILYVTSATRPHCP